MRRILAIAAVAFQVLALGCIAGKREWILATGRTVWLRTAPIDPRDVMRGDYLQLDYEIAHVPRSLWRDGLAHLADNVESEGKQTPVYAALRLDSSGVAEVTALSNLKPKNGLFIRGKLVPGAWSGGVPTVQYGLEAFFMEQGKAGTVEQSGRGDQLGVPLNMQVALGAGGIGVLKGYRWDALGITLGLETLRKTNWQSGFARIQNIIVAANVTLKNHGPEPVAVVDLPDGRSFGLECDARWQEAAYAWVGESNTVEAPAASDVIVLQPGESHTNHIDLTRPEWFITGLRTNAPDHLSKPIQQLGPEWNVGFRIQYRPPSDELCRKLPNAKLVWHGRLRSRWFNPVGTVD